MTTRIAVQNKPSSQFSASFDEYSTLNTNEKEATPCMLYTYIYIYIYIYTFQNKECYQRQLLNDRRSIITM